MVVIELQPAALIKPTLKKKNQDGCVSAYMGPHLCIEQEDEQELYQRLLRAKSQPSELLKLETAALTLSVVNLCVAA